MLHYFSDYFSTQDYPDDFGYSETWNTEYDKWLALAYELDRDWYDTGKTRVGKAKQRDEFLGEAMAVYFFHRFRGAKDITLEPEGKGNTRLDFAYLSEEGEQWLVEVKSPSWRGEVWKDTGLTKAQKEWRIKQPRHLDRESNWYRHEDAVEDPIRKTLPKLQEGKNNSLVIVPSMRVNTTGQPHGLLEHAVMSELNTQDPNHLISRVDVLEVVLPFLPLGQGIKYRHEWFAAKQTATE